MFLALMIATQERLEDSGTLLYPSITFCPKYIWQVRPPDISHSCYSLHTCRSSPGSWSSSTTTSPWTSTTSSSLPSPTSGLGRRCCQLCHVEPCNDLSPLVPLCQGVQLRVSPERGPQPVLPLQHCGRLQEGQTLCLPLHLPSRLHLITQPLVY